ncbi:fumarylacetoacetase [Aestuariicella hydrocarbonica]|uniref:fumarylacetoacetase n=1 Tax=Pseudomaricurvus hydrocarbonicus TaxID=1470433 RepID=A0A9E5JUS7_9GAMM|nr:fumarylacetoacetase [Aestuariicella hydrocarbonica]NHO66944.1 fumarylacetoacetase [Aestuariicella hydrocarbonica]
MTDLNETHDPTLSSWVDSANGAETDFPIQNLPFAAFRMAGSDEYFRGGVAIGDFIVDLAAVASQGIFNGLAQDAVNACAHEDLNEFMAMGKPAWSALRLSLSKALRTGSGDQFTLSSCLVAQADAEFKVPCLIHDYTDFYSSIHHATAVGKQFRPDNPLLPNYQWVPIGYHGRASSIGVSGQQFSRPLGQLKAPDADVPVLGPSRRLDYEVEVGIYIGLGNELGEPVSMVEAEDYVFGLCLFNDWSARDIQAWEYQPLGPFLAKSFASTVSPWIVTTEALAPFRVPFTRPENHPQPLPYLTSDANSAEGSFDVSLSCLLRTAGSDIENPLSRSSFKYSYWTVAQMVAHHTINGCNLQAGDLFGSGTQSGPEPQEAGSLLELTQGGKHPITLANGETRTFVEDGDTVIMRGYCEKPGAKRIGFGEVTSTVLPVRWSPRSGSVH